MNHLLEGNFDDLNDEDVYEGEGAVNEIEFNHNSDNEEANINEEDGEEFEEDILEEEVDEDNELNPSNYILPANEEEISAELQS